MATKKTTKVEEVKVVEAAKETVAKEVAAKEVAKKAPAKKAPAKKAPAKKAEVKKETVITIQFYGNEASVASIEEKVKAAFVAEGHKASSIKTLNVYVKPEEYSAYYVINEKYTGRVDLF